MHKRVVLKGDGVKKRQKAGEAKSEEKSDKENGVKHCENHDVSPKISTNNDCKGKNVHDTSKSCDREKDDGDEIPGRDLEPASVQDVAPSLENQSNLKNALFNKHTKPPSFQIEVDLVAMLLFFFAMFTRMWGLEHPRGIVFDELHYAKFASMYMKKTFFFDSNPPLGKQLIALAGYLAGFDGSSTFDRIGAEYGPGVPVWSLRAIPAFFGSLLVPTVYHLIVEMGFTHRTAILGGLLLILENSYLTQSRFILMESMLIWFSVFGILACLKFKKASQARNFIEDRKQENRASYITRNSRHVFQFWFWLLLCSISITCAVCVKYTGIYSALLVMSMILRDYWKTIANRSLSILKLIYNLFERFIAICLLPVCIYLFVFYIHLNVLTKAGPHDNVMTSAFQASLEGGLASITRGQPLEIAHGSQITLRHTHGRACWMHSHPHVYPLRYPDKRGSSHQQQVSCYSFKDVNNWWIVKRPTVNYLVVSDPIDKIRHGDVVQLVHGMSSRPLNSHDVAAPMSPQNQEVSCYIDYNISFPPHWLWKVEILNKDAEGDVWHTIHSHVRLIHVSSGQALKFSGKQLPEWGFNQHEMVTDRVVNQDDTIWNVEEHRYTKKSDQKELERDMGMAEFVPMQPTQLSFFEKMWELQYKMIITSNENVKEHMYSSEPLEWLFLTRGIAYWVSPDSNAQIHLLGNIITWHAATYALFVYALLMIFYILRRRRKFYDIPEEMWTKFCTAGELCLAGYLLNFVPYFVVERALFLHHYLPAYLFKIILLVTLVEHFSFLVCLVKTPYLQSVLRFTFMLSVCAWMLCVLYTFVTFSILCCGSIPLSADQVLKLRWKDTWDFIIHVQ